MAMIFAAGSGWACSPEPWSADPCRRADLPSCYYDWTTADGDRLGTCTSVLGRCEAEFTAILAMCKKDGVLERPRGFRDEESSDDRTGVRDGLLAYGSIGLTPSYD
jgi:hypothetical protein